MLQLDCNIKDICPTVLNAYIMSFDLIKKGGIFNFGNVKPSLLSFEIFNSFEMNKLNSTQE